MIDPNLLTRQLDLVIDSQIRRGEDPQLPPKARQALLDWREARSSFERLRAEQNRLGRLVPRASGTQKAELLEQTAELAAQIKSAQTREDQAKIRWHKLWTALPNVVEDEVPAGSEENFKTLKTAGRLEEFDFSPRDHLELGEALGAIDVARGAKVSGSRFYFLIGDGARLETALINLGLKLALDRGFIPVTPPTLVKPEIMAGTGFLGKHASEVYRLEGDDLYLTGTSEVALAGLHAREIIDLDSGALRYVGQSTCYRREAGSHGKDVRGIIRVHQFNKLEMFVYARPEEAQAEHKRLLALEQDFLDLLKLPYRVIDVAGGDLGSSAARKFDIEAWIPTQNAYRELTSTSNCTTFQARRLNTRFKNSDGSTEIAATLNGTLTTTRWIVAILENHQRADGSVWLPEALRPYMGGIDFLRPKVLP